ncbi:MAG: RibD family protein [Cyanobacteriota bacterium]|nr:RibD family protein [Cyanobacteriota bacterium]
MSDAASRLRPQTLLVLAISLDGRLAPASGGAAQLGGPPDRRVLEEALAWADGCLIGANTLRLHGSTCLIRAADLLAQRQVQGRSPQPLAVAVSRTGVLPPDLAFFNQPLERWLLMPAGAAPLPPSPQAGFARQLPLLSWPETLQTLHGAGLERLVVLGGAQLAASLLQTDSIDALQLTLCPQLLGGPHTWVPAEALLPHGLSGWRLAQQRPLGGDELLLRYERTRAA